MTRDQQITQPTPDEIVGMLMALVRGQFCGDLSSKEWGQHSHFIKRNVILWPAHFICNAKGFTMPAERYEAIMREVFDDIKAHGTQDSVRFWPGYLMKCVQDHWKHHWEEYYAESKAVRNLAMTAVMRLGQVTHQDRTVEALALARRALIGSKKPGSNLPRKAQLNLL